MLNVLLQVDAPLMLALILGGTLLLAIAGVALITKHLRRCPSNKLLVVFGLGIPGTLHVQHGGARLVWPLIQDHAYLPLDPFSAGFPEAGVLSRDGSRVTIKGEVAFAIGTTSTLMHAAAERLIMLERSAIIDHGQEELEAALRDLASQLSVELMFKDREKFSAELQALLQIRLEKFGMEVLSIRIGNMVDSAGIIEEFERKAAELAKSNARADQAHEEKRQRENAAFQERRKHEDAESAPRQRNERENQERSRKPPADVLKEDSGDALKNM